jgi:hypothetical protein
MISLIERWSDLGQLDGLPSVVRFQLSRRRTAAVRPGKLKAESASVILSPGEDLLNRIVDHPTRSLALFGE